MNNPKSSVLAWGGIQNSKSKRLVGLGLLLALAIGWLALPLTAAAHPLGNFTVNRYSRIEIGSAGVKIYYVLDMAEIPTFQEKDLIDLNRDGQISETERLAYLDRKATELQAGLVLTVDGATTPLKLMDKQLTFPDGQGGLQTTRLTASFETTALPNSATGLAYQDNNFADRLGWREIVVRNATGVALQQSSVSATDQSNELRKYPEDMLASPLAVTSAQASFKLDTSVVVNNSTPTETTGAAVRSSDSFGDLINGKELTAGVILASLLGALVLGMFHALSPGHGKTIVAAYLIGSRGTARHAVFLGLTVTVTHTIGVFALGLITLFASQYILPEKLYPWLGLASGLIVVAMGVTLFRARLRFATAKATPDAHLATAPDHTHEDHDHDHDHSHDHDHDHDHDHTHEHHDHDQTLQPQYAYAANNPLHDHDHNHESTYAVAYKEVAHDHDHDHDHDHTHEHTPLSPQSSVLSPHSHGGRVHTHLPPGTDGTAITWKRLLFFGISAGLLPCPSALVVMLSAIALGRVAFGLVLIVFFSIGLAGTLTGLGIALIYARRLMIRAKVGVSSKVIRILPVASALAIAIVGLAISYEALLQTGILNR